MWDKPAPSHDLDLASISPFGMGNREEEKEREAFENVSGCISSLLAAHGSAFTLAAAPRDTPVVHLLATRQLFSLL